MRCGNCKLDHPTVADVRACYEHGAEPTMTMPNPTCKGMEQGGPMWPPSTPQVNYAIVLQEERALPDEYVPLSEDEIKSMEKDEVSRLISELKALPYKHPKGEGMVQYDMPAGRYALHWDDEGWFFYQVDKPIQGHWKGYTFIKRLIGQPGADYLKVDMSKPDRLEALRAIAEDPKTAMVDYGKQSRHCGRCGSALSNDNKPGSDGLTSVQRGIGPECMKKDGWF